MGSDSRKPETGEARAFGPDTIECVMRERVRATIEVIVEEELEAALGAAPVGAGGRAAGRVSPRDAAAHADHEPGAGDDHDATGPARDGGW